jgi:acyl-coenzyme A thioesterase PaaI-like protein
MNDRQPTGVASRSAHHDLCFGCGLANPFGLQLELETGAGGERSGRFFVKQDHQGPDGLAHVGVLTAALVEAMCLTAGDAAGLCGLSLEVERREAAPVGAYVHVTARLLASEGSRSWCAAELVSEDGELAAAGRAVFVEPDERS